MGYLIDVNHFSLESAAKDIDDYVEVIKKYMKQADDEISDMISKNWKYEDALIYKNKWLDVSSSDSATEYMKSALRNYANALRYAKEQYKKAQSKAVNRAGILRLG